MMTTTTEAPSVARIDVELGDLADAFATVKRHRYGARHAPTMSAYRNSAAVASVDGGVVVTGGTPDTMVQVRIPEGLAEWGVSVAVPYDAVASAAKGARRMRAAIMPGCIQREDGATFEWQHAEEARDTLIAAWRTRLEWVRRGESGGVVASFECSAQSFRDVVSITAKASSRDESRPVLCGVALIATLSSDGMMMAAATDSYRLHACGVTDARVTAENDDAHLILPVRVAETLAKVKWAEAASIVGVRGDGGRNVRELYYRAEVTEGGGRSVTVCGVATTSAFPNVERLFGQVRDHAAQSLIAYCDADAFAAAARAAADLIGTAQRTMRPVRLSIQRDQAAIALEVVATDGLPGAQWTIPTSDTVQGGAHPGDGGAEAHTLGVNAAFLRDAALSVGGDIMRLTVYGAERPFILATGEEHDAPGTYGERCLVMPVRIVA